jgi:glyoxylase-like metal-dependent hydrolase (beta-lactamase superfamily II)
VGGAKGVPDTEEICGLMDTVKLIIEGYARRMPRNRWDATSSVVLAESGEKKIVIDPGMFPETLISALQKEGLELGDIDIVICSHSHLDHRRNSNLFPKTKVLDLSTSYKKMPEIFKIPDTDIVACKTPGHMAKHMAFLVDTAEGKCGIVGDVFWWEDTEEQKIDIQSLIEHADPLASDVVLLRESRRKLLSLADFIIPGHGKTFRTPHELEGMPYMTGEFMASESTGENKLCLDSLSGTPYNLT